MAVDRGAVAAEYALLIVLIAVFLVVAIGLFSDALQELFEWVVDTLGF